MHIIIIMCEIRASLILHLTSHLAIWDAADTNFYVVQLAVASKCPDKMYVPISLTS